MLLSSGALSLVAKSQVVFSSGRVRGSIGISQDSSGMSVAVGSKERTLNCCKVFRILEQKEEGPEASAKASC